MSWLIAVALKPFVVLAFFAFAFLVARLLGKAIPAGKTKTLLYDRSVMKRHPWKVGLGFMFAAYGLIGAIALLT